jgi:hypothetical protein
VGLFLICPYCQAKGPLASRGCSRCGADLRQLLPEQRRYFIGASEAIAEKPAKPDLEPEPIAASLPEVDILVAGPAPWEPEILPVYEAYAAQAPEETDKISLCEALDRVLNKGAVVVGEVMISVADIDLLYLGLQLILTSIETARELRSTDPSGLHPEMVR